MPQRKPYPKKPVRAAILTFVALAVFVGVCLPFQESTIRDSWPWAFAYCALLSVGSIGLVRLGRRVLVLIGIPFVVAVLPAIIGFTLMVGSTSLESGGAWLQLSLYLFYALGAWGAYWIARGWLLYYKNSVEPA